MNPASGAGDPGSKSSTLSSATMVAQSAMNAALSALRNAVGNDKKQKTNLNKIRDGFKAVEADEWPRSEMVERGVHLAEIISQSVTSLHKTRPQPTLAFCAAALSWLFKAKLEPTIERGDEENAKAWEDIMFQGLMEPILGIVDSEDQDLVGKVLYRAICGTMMSPFSHCFGGRFARSLALVLLSTCSSSRNKAMLLDSSIFGTNTLSKLIIDAKDYHYLDTLLELSFTMFSSQGGKVTRKAYADSIFSSGYALERLPDDISNELASIHSVTNGGNSEKHVLDIMRTMPQVFTTKDLSYCGTRFTQTPPSNVIILDNENLCVVFCDKNGESDVFVVALPKVKSVELLPQGASRIMVELAVAEQPLISSSREELAIPDSHIPGLPLKIQVSISSSDVFGLEAALAARDLVGVLKDDNALTRHSSLASAKISNAVSSIPLKKNRNTSNEQAEEMIRQYVNLPSSRDTSPPPTESAKTTIGTAQPKPLPPRTLVTPATVVRQGSPPRNEKYHNEAPLAPRPAAKQTLQPSVPASAGPALIRPAGSTTARTKRAAAEKSQKAIKLAALDDIDDSELTDVEQGATPEHTGRQTMAKTPAEDAAALPTPPRTRARIQQTKPVAKTLVPSTPTRDDPSEVSSPSNVPSLSPKPVKKRKLVEDDAFELPPLNPDRPAKQKKTAATKVLSNSQHIRPRDTAATRAKAKYGAISKRMRVSSPVESIHSADSEDIDSPPKKAPTKTAVKEHKDTLAEGKTTARRQPRLVKDKNDEPDVPKRQTRASATNTKPKPNPAAGVNTIKTLQNKSSDLNATFAPETEAAEILEPPKKKRGRPPKNKPTQRPVEIPEPPSRIVDSVEQPSSQLEPQNYSTLDSDKSTRTHRKEEVGPAVTTTAQETTPAIQEEDSEDDLLQRLSQAAKKALRPPVVDVQPVFSMRPTSSPTKGSDTEMEDPYINVDTIEPPALGLETRPPKDVVSQVYDMTPKSVQSVDVGLIIELSGTRFNNAKGTKTSTKEPMKSLDISQDTTLKSKPHPSSARSSTKLHVPKNTPTTGTQDEDSVDIVGTKPTPTPPQPTSATHQEDSKLKPTITYIETRVPAPQERKSPVTPETPVQPQPARTTERIQSEEVHSTVARSLVHHDETPPVKAARQKKFPPAFISVESNSDVEMELSQKLGSYQVDVEPTQHPSVSIPRITPTVRQVIKPQLHTASALAPGNAKHAAVTRVLFGVGTQPSPKSALASPQRRILPNGARPSVSFLEPHIPIRPPRRGSSGSSAGGAQTQQAYGIDREKLRKGHSARTGDVMLQIVDALTEIQETIASNLGEKVQIISAEARSARAELTKGVVEELDKMKAESESRHDVLHEFESAFTSQAQAMLKGLGQVVKYDDRLNTGIGSILSANARAGQSIANSAIDFQVPELFIAFLTS